MLSPIVELPNPELREWRCARNELYVIKGGKHYADGIERFTIQAGMGTLNDDFDYRAEMLDNALRLVAEAQKLGIDCGRFYAAAYMANGCDL